MPSPGPGTMSLTPLESDGRAAASKADRAGSIPASRTPSSPPSLAPAGAQPAVTIDADRACATPPGLARAGAMGHRTMNCAGPPLDRLCRRACHAPRQAERIILPLEDGIVARAKKGPARGREEGNCKVHHVALGS